MEQLGKYKILELIGMGGQAVVYKAEDSELGRMVALKVVNQPISDDPKYIASLKKEAVLASNLLHPNIATIYDFLTVENKACIVMELLQGSLDSYLSGGARLSPQSATKLFVQICAGVSYAHRQGITHRDIKPSNILLSEDMNPKISDFGLARTISSTSTLETVGTFAYMPPEQWQGSIADHRSDIYSLGITLYQVLSGVLPFTGPMASLLHAHINEAIPNIPPSSSVPRSLEDIVKKMVEKDPRDRFSSVNWVSEALQNFLELPANLSRKEQQVKCPECGNGFLASESELTMCISCIRLMCEPCSENRASRQVSAMGYMCTECSAQNKSSGWPGNQYPICISCHTRAERPYGWGWNCIGCGDWACQNCAIHFEFCGSRFCPYCAAEANIDGPVCPKCLTGGVDEGLFKAVMEGDLSQINKLVSEGANVNIRERMCHQSTGTGDNLHKGRTSLYYAIDGEDLKTIRHLIDLGADASTVSLENPDEDIDLFELASSKGNVDILNLLLQQLDIRDPTQEDLYFAVRNGNAAKTTELLKDHSISIHQTDWLGDSPLVIATYGGHTEIVEMLLLSGADVNVRNFNGATCSELATINGFNDIFQLMLEYGLDPYSEHSDASSPSWTPLYGAVSCNNFNIAMFYLTNGADPNEQAGPNNKDVPLCRAVRDGGDVSMVKALVEHGASLNATGLLGESLLDIAYKALNPNLFPYRPIEKTQQIIDYLRYSIDQS